jgi:hypothetical protein
MPFLCVLFSSTCATQRSAVCVGFCPFFDGSGRVASSAVCELSSARARTDVHRTSYRLLSRLASVRVVRLSQSRSRTRRSTCSRIHGSFLFLSKFEILHSVFSRLRFSSQQGGQHTTHNTRLGTDLFFALVYLDSSREMSCVKHRIHSIPPSH